MENKNILEEIKIAIPEEKKWSNITKYVLGFFGTILVLSYLNIIPTDYNIFFLLLSIATGFYWYKEKKIWKQYLQKDKNGEWIRPWWLSYTANLFPMILFVFCLRGFVGELFKIPTGSMIPNIMIGEVTVTNKLSYDFKIPVLEKSLFKISDIKRGDIVVFRYPVNPTTYYIKRFVGLPGDSLEYNNETKSLTINGKEISKTKISNFEALGKKVEEYQEDLLGVKHSIWIEPKAYNIPNPSQINFPLHENCSYSLEKIKCVIPKGYYFGMGDNRDNSADSRFWGFIPHSNIVGKAELIIYSPVDLKRVGWLN